MKVSKESVRKYIDDINFYRGALGHKRTDKALEALGQAIDTKWPLLEVALEDYIKDGEDD